MMKTTIITDERSLDTLKADASYFYEEAQKYGYTLEDFEFSVTMLDNGKIKVVIYEDGITVQVEENWIQFLEGYVLDGYLIRTDRIKIENISITF